MDIEISKKQLMHFLGYMFALSYFINLKGGVVFFSYMHLLASIEYPGVYVNIVSIL